MTLLKIMLFCVFGVVQCVYAFKVKKTTLFSTYCTLLLLLYAPPFWKAQIFTKLIVLRNEVYSDWPAIQCVVIGRIPQAGDGNVMPLPYCDAMSWCDDTTTLSPIINETFLASSGDILNDLYGLFKRCVASRRLNITMSAFVIGEMTNNKHYTLLITRVWIISGKFFQ